MDYERPSGRALTGHDDNYDWIELMARSPSGEIVARAFARKGDHEAIGAWRKRFNNTGVSHSICVYASPTREERVNGPYWAEYFTHGRQYQESLKTSNKAVALRRAYALAERLERGQQERA
jgi:hypothetical protein